MAQLALRQAGIRERLPQVGATIRKLELERSVLVHELNEIERVLEAIRSSASGVNRKQATGQRSDVLVEAVELLGPVTPKDVLGHLSLEHGSRKKIYTALHRLVKSGRLVRVATGLYDTPERQRVVT